MSELYSRIAASAPVNRSAAVVVGKGEHYEPKIKLDCPHWDCCPRLGRLPAEIDDLTGRKLGRFTVVGFYRMAKKGPLWIVKCACGSFETRRHVAIKRQTDTFFGCRKCHREKQIRDRVFFDAYGRWPDEKR